MSGPLSSDRSVLIERAWQTSPQQLKKAEKGIPLANRKQFEDVAGPKCLQPFGEILLRDSGGSEMLRESAAQEPALGRLNAKRGQLAVEHR